MHPILFEIRGVTLYSYGVLLAAAYLLGLRFAVVRGRARGLNDHRVIDLGIWIIVGALAGAKLLLLVTNWHEFGSPAGLLALVRAGGVFYGGLLLAPLVGLAYVRWHSLPLWITADAFAPGVALGHVVGRFGCLMAGCCYGRPTSMPWGITFTNPLAAANVGTPLGVPLHPTQLYEAGAELLILGGLLAMERTSRGFPGRTFWTYLLLYGISRFIIEFYRGDNRGTVFQVLSTSQFVSVILVPLSIVMLLMLARSHTPTEDRAVQRAAA